MAKEKARIKVKLLKHGKLPHESFEADIRRFEQRSQYGFPSAEIISRIGKSTIFQTINLETYHILEIEAWPPGWVYPYNEEYEPTESDQKEALLALAESWRDKEWEDSANNEGEPEVVGESAPKRLEIVVENHGMTAKRLLVTDVVPPDGHFEGFTVAGRLYEGEQWESKSTYFYSLSATINKIEAYLRVGLGSTSEFFKPHQQTQSWESLHNFFTKFTVEELEAVRKWQPKKKTTSSAYADDDDWPYCPETGRVYSPGGSWTQQTPYHYQPKKVKPAHFRVAGDEVGALLHKDQLERQEKAQTEVGAKVGALVEKKAEAGAEESSSQASGQTSSGPGNSLRSRGLGLNASSNGGSGIPDRFRLSTIPGRPRALIVDGKVITEGSDSIH